MIRSSNFEKRKNTTALIILDGWGYREAVKDNAITTGETPVFDNLWQKQPNTLLQASSSFVGLPSNQMGNSEVGHMNIGAGRVVFQDLVRVDNAIQEGTFYKNTVFCNMVGDVINQKKAIHILGLISSGGVAFA